MTNLPLLHSPTFAGLVEPEFIQAVLQAIDVCVDRCIMLVPII